MEILPKAFRNKQKEVHETAIQKGWHGKRDPEVDRLLALVCLMHEELSEACSAIRLGNPPDDKVPEFSGVEAELADVIIRVMDLAQSDGYNVIGALMAKCEMNKTRKIRHGGKLA